MNYKELKQHASDCQLAADEIAGKFIKMESISIVQSICDFNLSWLYQLSPEVLIHSSTIEFLMENIKNFKRKITIQEMLNYDLLITCKNINTFEEFKQLFKTKTK